MFELSCPSCGHKRVSPFIRVSAATRCPKCGHVWRISESQIVKQPMHPGNPAAPGKAPGSPAAVAAEPLVPKPEPNLGDAAEGKEDPRMGSSVVGLSGLSEIMQAEPGGGGRPVTDDEPQALPSARPSVSPHPAPAQGGAAHAAPHPHPTPIPPQPPHPAPPRGRPMTPFDRAKQQDQQRRRRHIAVLGIALLAAFVALVGVVLIMWTDPGNTARTPGPPGPKDDAVIGTDGVTPRDDDPGSDDDAFMEGDDFPGAGGDASDPNE